MVTRFPEGGHARRKVGPHHGALAGHHVFFFQNCGDVKGQRFSAAVLGHEHHSRDARMARQHGHASTQSCGLSVAIQCAKQPQLGQCPLQVGCWRRCEPGHRGDVRLAESSYGQRHGSQVGIFDFGVPLQLHAVVGGRGPQAVAHPWGHAPGASGALQGHVVADAHRLQMAQTVGGVEHELAAVAAVHHDAHALDGQRGLGNGRGQHHLALSPTRRCYGHLLLSGREVAIERIHLCGGKALSQQFCAAHDVGLAWQKGKDVALTAAVDSAHHGRHRLSHMPCVAVFLGLHHFHGKHAPLARYDLCPQCRADGSRVDGGRHDHKVEFWPQDILDLPGKAQGHVRLQAAFVKLVEDDACHTLQGGVVHHSAGEDALCDYLDARLGRQPSFESDLIAHGLAYILAQHLCHAHGHLASRQTARLQHDDIARGQSLEYGEWQQR